MIFWSEDLKAVKKRLLTGFLRNIRFQSIAYVTDIRGMKPMHVISVRKFSSGSIGISVDSMGDQSYSHGSTVSRSTHVFRTEGTSSLRYLSRNSKFLRPHSGSRRK